MGVSLSTNILEYVTEYARIIMNKTEDTITPVHELPDISGICI
jgi:hypothetical protein